MNKHICFRMYKNADNSPFLILDDTQLVEWERGNEKKRPGCAQFVDGKCVFSGYLTAAQIELVETWFAGNLDHEATKTMKQNWNKTEV